MQSGYLISGTSDLIKKDKDLIWHPFTSLNSKENILISHAEGVWLYTEKGRKILDGISSWWVNILGHSNPIIAAAIESQSKKLEHVIFAGFTHEPAIQLAESLVEILPNKPAKVFFSDNGSTAVEVALKVAIQFWYNQDRPKKKIIALEGSYHGDTFGAMATGSRGLFSKPFEEHLFEVDFLPFPDSNNISEAEKKLDELCKTEEVAAFIFEPLVQGTAGMRIYPKENLDRLLEIASKYEVITIADEVFTGFGRTGSLFACDQLNNVPDLVAVSKGITGGFLPLGITAANARVVQGFQNQEVDKVFFHGHSYTGNPLACAAANASIGILLQGETRNKIQELASWQSAFVDKISGHDKINRINSLGTILSMEVKGGKGEGYTGSMRDYLYQYFLDRNILLRPLGNVLYFVPPYIIQKEEVELVHREIEQLLKTL